MGNQDIIAEMCDGIRAYVAGETTLDTFVEFWHIGIWNLDEAVGPETQNLSYRVHLLLAEYSHGDWTEQELRGQLAMAQTEAMS